MEAGHQFEQKPASGSHVSMTKGCSSNGDKRGAQRKRDKDHDHLGNRYDTRAGTWGDYDGAEDDYETLLGSWLTPERC